MHGLVWKRQSQRYLSGKARNSFNPFGAKGLNAAWRVRQAAPPDGPTNVQNNRKPRNATRKFALFTSATDTLYAESVMFLEKRLRATAKRIVFKFSRFPVDFFRFRRVKPPSHHRRLHLESLGTSKDVAVSAGNFFFSSLVRFARKIQSSSSSAAVTTKTV